MDSDEQQTSTVTQMEHEPPPQPPVTVTREEPLQVSVQLSKEVNAPEFNLAERGGWDSIKVGETDPGVSPLNEGKAHAINMETNTVESDKEVNPLNDPCPLQSLTQSFTAQINLPKPDGKEINVSLNEEVAARASSHEAQLRVLPKWTRLIRTTTKESVHTQSIIRSKGKRSLEQAEFFSELSGKRVQVSTIEDGEPVGLAEAEIQPRHAQ
nr:hypothetical protein CFP56_76717 [Quercus suber]